jgi:hypothetical protein
MKQTIKNPYSNGGNYGNVWSELIFFKFGGMLCSLLCRIDLRFCQQILFFISFCSLLSESHEPIEVLIINFL